jgi:hypothetical protein
MLDKLPPAPHLPIVGDLPTLSVESARLARNLTANIAAIDRVFETSTDWLARLEDESARRTVIERVDVQGRPEKSGRSCTSRARLSSRSSDASSR